MVVVGIVLPRLTAQTPKISDATFRAASSYLDRRLDWWLHWPNAARDHDTACVSCHTALPYALARPAMHQALHDGEVAGPEQLLLANVVKRVRLWKDVEPFYPDQTRGLPKTSESRGTESVLNAVILASRDAQRGELSEDGKLALANMWALQFKSGELKGAWAWLNFHNEPWESNDSAFFGASLAALAVGNAPGYAKQSDGESLKFLTDYLQQRADKESLYNQLMALLAASKIPSALSASQRQNILNQASSKQHSDGGWSMADLGSWKRSDGTALDTASDGCATGLVTLALQRAGLQRNDIRVSKGIAWLLKNQDPATGAWTAFSLNKQRDPASDIGKFMSDAATGYAVLALLEGDR